MPTPGSTAPAQLTITIASDRDGKATMLVSLHDANGAPMVPPREISVDLGGRLAAFVDAVQAIAGQQLSPIKSPAERRTPDSEPMIAGDAAYGE